MRHLTWRPAGRRNPVLDRLDLHIDAGQRVLLAGPSGSGKSTLLRAVAGLLLTAAVGEQTGEIRIDGRAPQERPGAVGLLLQDPSAAIVASRVGRDVAFGLENTAVPRADMKKRVRQALDAAHFPYGESRLTGTLSGGETQRLAMAGALALNPTVLLLDEPTSMLDDENARHVREAVLEVVERSGATLVVVEHRLEPWLPRMDRCIVLDASGRVTADGEARSMMRTHATTLAAQGIWAPGVPAPTPEPIDVSLVAPTGEMPHRSILSSAHDVVVRHRSPFANRQGPSSTVALDGVDCALETGSTLSMTGPSGAGKSTLLAVLSGLQEPDSGSALIHPDLAGPRGRHLAWLRSAELARHLSWVPQLPEHGLVRTTVLDEVLTTSRALGYDERVATRRALLLLEALGLAGLEHAQVHHLSGGEQRRLVVAAALVHGPVGLLLDEPTVGQDRLTWAAVMGACETAVRAGAGVAVATHDRLAVARLTASGGARLPLDHGRVATEAA